MRKWLVAGVVLASCTVAVAQEPPASAPKSGGSWFTRMFTGSAKADTAKDKDKDKDKKAEPAKVIETAEAARLREELILNRRNQVILKLREIAFRTQDDALLRKVEELDERANALYLRQTAHVPQSPGDAPAKNLAREGKR